MKCVLKTALISKYCLIFQHPFFLPFHIVKRSVCGCDHLAPLFGSYYPITAAGKARNQLLAFTLLSMSD